MFQALISGELFSSGPLGELIEMGGPVMVVLIAMAIAGTITFVYLMLYGVLYAPRQTRGLRRAMQQWKSGPDPKVADQLRARTRGLNRLNPLNQLVLMVMDRKLRNESAEHIREAVAQKAQLALTPFEAPLKIVEVIAALAPLLGLLGTVMGMMEAFSTMAAAEGRASASQLSGGIYQALTTTAAGLVVAIPFAALAAWIEFRLRRLQTNLNLVLMDTLMAAPASAEATTEAPVQKPATSPSQPAAKPIEPEVDWQGHQAVANAVR